MPHLQVEVAATKSNQKVSAIPSFNIIENMKKMNVTMSMWDSLAIPGQKDILQSALSDLKVSKDTTVDPNRVVLTNSSQDNNKQPNKSAKPLPFYKSLIIADKLVHNCMVDSGASSSMMPK